MAGSHSDVWSRKVGEVFDVRPRVAIDDLSRWIERREERKLRNSLVSPGMHVCLYGPSGSGKTSLAKSIAGRLHGKDQKFIIVRINHNTSWKAFKSQIVENKQSTSKSRPFSFKIKLQTLLPYVEIEKNNNYNDFTKSDLRSEFIDQIDIYHISNYLVDNGVVLVVDDVNFASEELLKMLTSLAKEMIDIQYEGSSKILFVGADDIFIKIMASNDSLKDRTEEISLGSIRADDGRSSTIRDDKVWKYICDGLIQLGLTDPRKDRYISRDEVMQAKQWIEYAADGLPKSVVSLGKKIAEKGERRSRVSFTDLVDASREMVNRNFRHYRSKYRTLFALIKEYQLAAQVCAWLFENGASGIHSVEEIAEDLHHSGSYLMVDEAIQFLAEKDFLVVTGTDNNVFFAKDPLLAHTIGVVLTNPTTFEASHSFLVGQVSSQQLLLRFSGSKEPENKDKL